jgi:hypothetical protein
VDDRKLNRHRARRYIRGFVTGFESAYGGEMMLRVFLIIAITNNFYYQIEFIGKNRMENCDLVRKTFNENTEYQGAKIKSVECVTSKEHDQSLVIVEGEVCSYSDDPTILACVREGGYK